MRGTRSSLLAMMVACFFVTINGALAQRNGVGPGSTPQGDMLRGEGVFLQGAGWYELNSARGRSIDQQTQARISTWNENYYAAQRQIWAKYVARKEGQSQKTYEIQVARAKEKELRLRTNPNQDDVAKGDALNALLLDLSDPRFTDTDWRVSKVPLPVGMSISGIVYSFAPKTGAKGSDSLSRGVIALSRLGVKEWPIVLRDQKLDAERKAYEAAYTRAKQECIDNRLSLETVLAVKSAIKALKAKANSAIPTDLGYRKAAVEFVDRLGEATGMFHADTVDYASEIVKDTQEHDATTVGELLAFMRKYRLIFSSAEGVPGGGDTYGQLYGAMQKQKKALGIKDMTVSEEPRPTSTKDDRSASKDNRVLSKDDMITKIVAARSFVHELDFRGNEDRKPHKVAATKALNDAEVAVKAGRFPKNELATASKELQALTEIGIKGKINVEKIRSASQAISDVQKMTK